MALSKCRECGKEGISTKAASCPGCGRKWPTHWAHPWVENLMLIAVLAVIWLILEVTGFNKSFMQGFNKHALLPSPVIVETAPRYTS